MSRSRAFLLSAVLLVNPVLLAATQKATKDFNTFLATFKTAVEKKDTETLARLMSPSFDFIRATNVPPGAVFSALDSNHGQQWLNLQQAVQGTPVPYAGSGPYKNSRVLRCTPLAVSVQLPGHFPEGFPAPLALARHGDAHPGMGRRVAPLTMPGAVAARPRWKLRCSRSAPQRISEV